MININFKDVYFTVQRAIPFLNKPASIVLISSMACHSGWPSHSVYSSTKAAVSMLARNFSADLIHKGITPHAGIITYFPHKLSCHVNKPIYKTNINDTTLQHPKFCSAPLFQLGYNSYLYDSQQIV